MGIIIKGIGKNLPKRKIENKYFESFLETSDKWITERTGMKVRYHVDGESASELSLPACKEAIKDANLTNQDIDCIIVTTVTPDYMFPTTACMLQEKLDMPHTPAFDMMAGCTGFIYGCEVAQGLISTGQYNNILVVAVEVLSSILNMEDRNTAVLFGDGASAVVLSKDNSSKGILSSFLSANGKGKDNLILPASGSVNPISKELIDKKENLIKMNGRAVFKDAVRMMIKATENALDRANLKKEDIDLFIPHQANKRIIEAIANFFEIDTAKVYVGVDKYGNTSSSTIPLSLYDCINDGTIKEGNKVLLTAFGAGYTYGAIVLQF